MRTLYNAFAEHVARRRGILRALTLEAEQLLARCNPNIANVCLYGHSDGSWEVCMPSEEVPSELPEPVMGINYARDSMTREEWLSLVAIYSDSWLISIAFFSGARMCKEEREEMFQLINRLPTCYEIVSGVRRTEEWEIMAECALQDMRSVLEHQDPDSRYLDNSDESHMGHSDDLESNSEEESEVDSEIGISEPSGMEELDDPDDLPPRRAVVHEVTPNSQGDVLIIGEKEESTLGVEEEEGDPCPSCGKLYAAGDFWIACDFCDMWYCGGCAGMDEENSQEVAKWKCEECRRAEEPY